VVNANDAAKVNRIAERFALSTVDVERIREDIKKARETKTKQTDAVKERSVPPSEKTVHSMNENMLDELLNGPKKTEHKQPADISNPMKAGMEKSIPSAPSSRIKGDIAKPERPSVRRQIKEIRNARKQNSVAIKEETRQTTHQQPARSRKNKNSSKGR
jgi:hypothetical protein